MDRSNRISVRQVQRVPVPAPQATIDTSAPQRMNDDEPDGSSLAMLHAFASANGENIAEMLDPGELSRLGNDAVREFDMDAASRRDWLERAERDLNVAAQEGPDDEREPNLEGAGSDVEYPILSTAAGQFLARSAPELIKGDKVVGVKVFSPPSQEPSPIDQAKAGPQPQNDQQAQQAMQALQMAQQAQQQQAAFLQARTARANRVKHYMNWVIFYQMPEWEDDTDLLLLQCAVVGSGLKKTYRDQRGFRSDFLSSTCLTVHADTKSLYDCPRITQEFEIYPNEIEERRRAGVYSDIYLPREGDDPETPRKFIEQHRLDDLDGDGLKEPYIVTVDVETRQLMRIEPSYSLQDIFINAKTGGVIRIERWMPFSKFMFLPDTRGRFYGLGLGRLLESITDSVNTTINQLIDAGSAEIAGGGFIGSGVRLQGSGQGGSVFWRPGEYLTVSSPGIDLKQAIWERTVPHPSPVAFQMLELLLGAAKDIASVKDVITGDAPSTAPVGTTLALQNQALQVFNSIYKRIYRGFKDEFHNLYKCIQRWATDADREKYTELTGGDLDEDFAGDGTDIEPVADPTVASKMQKISKYQTWLQLAESPVGQAAGMTQSGPAQEFVKDFGEIIDMDRPERFIAQVAPNPELVAKTQDMQAAAGLKQAQGVKAVAEAHRTAAEIPAIDAKANKDRADTVKTVGETVAQSHAIHQEADRIHQDGDIQPPPEPEAAGTAT